MKRIAMYFLTWLTLTISVHFIGYSQTIDPESVTLVERDGEWFIKHNVEKGETLYSLSRMYGLDVKDITNNNPGSSEGIAINEVLLMPVSGQFIQIHRIKSGETLYSISRMYDVEINDLRRWNNIERNEISVNQELKIFIFGHQKTIEATTDDDNGRFHKVQPGESLYGISREYNVSLRDLKNWNNLETNEIAVGQKLIVRNTLAKSRISKEDPGRKMPDQEIVTQVPEDVPDNEDTVALENPLMNFQMENERGMAELIEDSHESSKYLALHRKAPKGTILTVRNELNDQVVFVRVIGPIPDTGINEKVVVKISRNAWEKLGAVNKRLRVKVSYML